MPLDSAWNAYIFRDGKTSFAGATLIEELATRLLAFQPSSSKANQTELLDLLLRGGELECALHDSASPCTTRAELVTNSIAESVVLGKPLSNSDLARTVRQIVAPERVSVAPPEGFAYYALHPLDFADLARALEIRSRFVAVIGIRSIGTTLSAVVQAALHGLHVCAERITVRPSGHPYNRSTEFTPSQQHWVSAMRSRDAQFLVVDEGPGMSGSSFLSVGEALLGAGVPRSGISFLCTRCPADPSQLTAPNAAERWLGFRAHYTEPTRHLPQGAKEYIAGGIWRARAFASESEWPASWIQMERLKFLSADGARLFRFEGFGRFGDDVYRRARKVAEAGFGPTPQPREEGFGVYPMLRGRYLTSADATPIVLKRIAEYCAFRSGNIGTQVEGTPELESMLRFNVAEEFGVELPPGAQLMIEKPVIADGRMLPHKWISVADSILKLDAATHGDDHFFPGPTDIAWDLAGAIIEWDLASEAANFLLDTYRAVSGDQPSSRLPIYLLAYAVFRCAFCKMAAAASYGISEYPRLVCDYRRYRERAFAVLESVYPTLKAKPIGQAA